MSENPANRLRLGVNVDHVATVRNARGGVHPDPVRAALTAAEAGADGITAHLREDRRHISDADIARLMAELTVSKPTLIAWSPKIQYQIQTGGLPPQNRIPVKKR